MIRQILRRSYFPPLVIKGSVMNWQFECFPSPFRAKYKPGNARSSSSCICVAKLNDSCGIIMDTAAIKLLFLVVLVGCCGQGQVMKKLFSQFIDMQ